MCCGETAEAQRTIPGDRFRLCVYSQAGGADMIINLDDRDVVDTASVLLSALSSDAAGRVLASEAS
ncbi:hypothetical protein LCGC14_0930100 [marine sediment metagenome]|uniref:Uncharacterized protein n=1 Tax=marine sediment metagenome TaxID=412755 RepID=A0A0F9NN93_9ZZZZ